MSSLLFTVEGLFHGDVVVSLERLLDGAGIDEAGRILVPIVDVLAMLRIDVAADLLVVRHRCGAACAHRLGSLLAEHDMHLQLRPGQRCGAGRESWSASLWSPKLAASVPSSPVTTVRATSFAAFVGVA